MNHVAVKKHVVALAWHVSSWDSKGWKDTFGDKKYTERQRLYGMKHKMKSLTPQFMVGNRPSKKKMGVSIREALRVAPKVSISCTAVRNNGSIEALIRVKKLSKETKIGSNYKVVPVLFQRKAITHCLRGENKGVAVVQWYPVRQALKPMSLEDAFGKGTMASFVVPEKVKLSELGVAVLLEDPKTLDTLECRSFSIKAK